MMNHFIFNWLKINLSIFTLLGIVFSSITNNDPHACFDDPQTWTMILSQQFTNFYAVLLTFSHISLKDNWHTKNQNLLSFFSQVDFLFYSSSGAMGGWSTVDCSRLTFFCSEQFVLISCCCRFKDDLKN